VIEISAVLFDLDGVLVDSSASVERHWTAWAARHRLDPEAVMRVVHGHRTLDAIAQLAPHLDARAESAELDDLQAADTTGVVAMPGAAQLIAGLGLPWAVVTSGSRGIALARLQAAALPAPEVLVSAGDVARGKPDPEGYLAAAHMLSAAPQRCVVIEDAATGVRAAVAAGMRTIAVLSTHSAAELQAADIRVERTSDVPAALERLARISL
jgi:sugar-phosphatase